MHVLNDEIKFGKKKIAEAKKALAGSGETKATTSGDNFQSPLTPVELDFTLEALAKVHTESSEKTVLVKTALAKTALADDYSPEPSLRTSLMQSRQPRTSSSHWG